ncbi:MAG TPA: tyrosine-type recombinase/integrase [Verrucomicrobiota bacterium]|nr:tyrosine-type recombinase/integrase [Verrucomicrobiota bacterium]HNU52956.1 tyrosine-type recombinase/integrase [Verrucomicrobiota bacterium]
MRAKARATKREEVWPVEVRRGGASVKVYQNRSTKGGVVYIGYAVADYSSGKRKFLYFSDLSKAKEKAGELADRMGSAERDVLTLTSADRASYLRALEILKPSGVALEIAAVTLAECLKVLPDHQAVIAAAQHWAQRLRTVTPKPVSEVVTAMLEVKRSDEASPRYLQDLRFRLGRFADAFHKDISDVTTAEIQLWLDSQKNIGPQSKKNHKRVLHALFAFAVARGYAADNPVDRVEVTRPKGGDTEVFTPDEMAKLIDASDHDFLPCILLGAFAGLRSAEIERLEWKEVDLVRKHITIGRDKSKTASRRVVPICDALAAWLAPYAGRQGKVWIRNHKSFYSAQQATAKKAGIAWKSNALRHSYASYRFAELQDAGRVAGELGNSAAIVHRHYRELVTPQDATRWFSLRPQAPANVIAIPTAANA